MPILKFLLLSVTLAAACLGASTDRQPNVILILADDLGYEAIRANGGTSYRTPSLDKLASGGVRFEHCYAQPLCTPTRVQLMTGASNVRNYVSFGEMDPKLTTFGNLFRNAGYSTCVVGKWQLGRDKDLPRKFGFDEACLWQHLRRPPRYANPGLEINGTPKDFSNGEYGPDLINDYALDFITRHKDAPFFLYYPMILPHDPFQPTPGSPDWDPKAIGERVNDDPRHFGDMVAHMDQLVGRVIRKLEELGLQERTLVVFLGDNGTGQEIRSQMGQLVIHGGKGRTTGAGMHVPLIVSWPGHIGSGKACRDLVDTTDILPTLCKAASIRIPPGLVLDGRSFLPQLRGHQGHPREWIYSWYSSGKPNGPAAREFAFDHHFKLYRTGEFFDLRKDADELHPMHVPELEGDYKAASLRLKAALDSYQNARPPHLQ